MRKRLTIVDGSLAVILPPELLERYGIAGEVELTETEGGLFLRAVPTGMSFEEATDHLFEEKDDLLDRLSQA